MSPNLEAKLLRIESVNLTGNFQGWKLKAPAKWMKDLYPQGQMNGQLHELISFAEEKAHDLDFRREIQIGSVHLLVAVLASRREILVGHRRLSHELTLLAAGEDHHPLLSAEWLQSLKEIRAHVEAMGTFDQSRAPSEWEWVTWRYQLPDLLATQEWKEVDELGRDKLRQLIRHVQTYRSTMFERLSDWGLNLTAQFVLVRIHLLKFLALLPSLDHDKRGHEVKRNLIESLRRLQEDQSELRRKGVRHASMRPLPRYYAMGLSIALQWARLLPAYLLSVVVRFAVRKMARRFIAGESISSSSATLKSLQESRRDATLDQLGELVVSRGEADEYLERVLSIIQGLKLHIQPGEKNAAGILKAHVSVKVSALSHEFRPQAFESTYQVVAPRLKRLLLAAKAEQVFINIDAEHIHFRDLVFRIYRRILLETPELRQWDQTGIVLQCYLRDAYVHWQEILQLARERGVRMPLRLVKGAYWDAETIEASAHQLIAPQFLNKEESDLHFRQLAALTLKEHQHLHLTIGSHNLQDHCWVEALRSIRYSDAPVIEHQCLHMTYEALSHGLARMGWPTRNYMPVGNLLIGMAYLVRRIMENSSQVGILTIMRSHNKREAFQSPVEVHLSKRQEGLLVRDNMVATLESHFRNCPPTRFYVDKEREEFMQKLQQFSADLSQQKFTGPNLIHSSSHPSLVVGAIEQRDVHYANQITEQMYQSFQADSDWSKAPVIVRVNALLNAADLMWQQKYELSALIIYEAGKTWTEALGDVEEAIDFLAFYAREELKLSKQQARWRPRGIFAVISPWNFPLAIPCGMCAAPLVAGNKVILKPAEQTPLIAERLVDILHMAGVPKDALAIVQGEGETVGAALVKHEKVAGIVFTGSKAVGTWIYREAHAQWSAHPWDGVKQPKKVITEMGGKNAIVVTNNCELDETVSGIIQSAFGHAGQKCSAASRVYVHHEVKDALLARLKHAIEDLATGPATDPRVLVNPLITAADQARVRQIVLNCRSEAESFGGKVWVDRSQEETGCYAVGPSLIELPYGRSLHPESWAQREIFGPVLHVMGYGHMSDAVEGFNSTEYALTGGIFGQSQDDIDELLGQLKAGNLYVNRSCTGARVAIEPFGGFKMSGTGPKAGGRDYLASFHVPIPSVQSESVPGFIQTSGLGFMIPRPSQLSASGRRQRFSKFAQTFLERYEAITLRVNEQEKEQMRKLSDWLKDDLADYLSRQHSNLRIPGQLGYDAKNFFRESGLIVVHDKSPSLQTLASLLTNMALGAGLAVMCLTDESYVAWKAIVDAGHQAGLSKNNLEVYLANEGQLKEALEFSEIQWVHFEGATSVPELLWSKALRGEALKNTMRLLLCDSEMGTNFAPETLADIFTIPRSVAVNTMRHGAPLETGLAEGL